MIPKHLIVEILDHIFSFLVSHQSGTLFACSKDPLLSPIVERQLFHHTTVRFAQTWLDDEYNFTPDRLSKIVDENPRILNYVRILEIEVDHLIGDDTPIKEQLDKFAETMLLFPLLGRIMLTTSQNVRGWYWPHVFQAALEDRLSLPTVKDVHFVGNQHSPFPLIRNCKNIENLLLSGSFTVAEEVDDSPPLQLKSLTLFHISRRILPSVALRANELQSLKCAESSVNHIGDLLEACSNTLNKLDIDLTYSQYSSKYTFQTGKVDYNPLTELSPIPPNLQQLTMRALVSVENGLDEDCTPNRCESYLPAAADIINLFIPSPPHLILDINIELFGISPNLANVDFSPLAVLGTAALSIPRIDLYVHTDILPADVTFAQLLASLADYEDVMRSIEQDILVIHPERTAPDYVED